MIDCFEVSSRVLSKSTAHAKNRNRTPMDVIHMLKKFSQRGNFAEVRGWEDYYSSAHSCYTALRHNVRRMNLPIDVVIRGDKVYLGIII